MNKDLFRSFMVRHGDTYKDIAEVLDITEASVSAKINENNTEFKQSEITKLKDRYNLTPDDVDAIFFN